MTNGNDELSDDAKGRGVTVQECEGAGVRWRWSAKGLECEGAGVRWRWSAKGLGCEGAGVRWRWGAKGLGCDGAAPRKGPGVTVRDGAGRCRMVRDGTGRHNRAQPGAGGAGGRNRAQKGVSSPCKPCEIGRATCALW